MSAEPNNKKPINERDAAWEADQKRVEAIKWSGDMDAHKKIESGSAEEIKKSFEELMGQLVKRYGDANV